MDSNLTIIIFLIGIFIVWTFWSINKKAPTIDDILVQNYSDKSSYKQRLVLVIESYNTIEDLLTLIRNILTQDIKVDSLVLISPNESLNRVKLIQDTCVLNKMGGLSFLLKESDNNTIILFIFPDSFNAFSNPHFLNTYLKTDGKVNGLIRVETNSVSVEPSKVYQS
jgi:hypothetical protein